MAAFGELAELWRWFVAEEATGYSPLYSSIVEAMAVEEEVLALVASAPEASQYPLLLLAAVHDLVLAGELPDLAEVYRGERPFDDAPPLFRAAVLGHRDHVLRILHERTVQTNECGRAAPLALGLATVAAELGVPDVLVDGGASAGLNLLYDRYRLEIGDDVWGDPNSSIVCPCDVRGTPPPALRFADVPVRVGLDRSPVDVTDPVAARWLLACTWPDTGRLARTHAAIALGAASPPDVRTGDLVECIGPLLDALSGGGLVCVVTSWTLGYLDLDQRAGFLDAIAAASRARPIVLLTLEHPRAVPGIVAATAPATTFAIVPSVVGMTTFGSSGLRSPRAVAYVHPHGNELEWI